MIDQPLWVKSKEYCQGKNEWNNRSFFIKPNHRTTVLRKIVILMKDWRDFDEENSHVIYY